MSLFCLWADHCSRGIPEEPAKWDADVARFISVLRRNKAERAAGNYLVSGLRYFLPGIPFPRAAKAMKAWGLKEPSEPHPCMPESCNRVIVEAAVRKGWIHVAGWVRCSFMGYFRISSSARIIKPNVALPGTLVSCIPRRRASSPSAVKSGVLLYGWSRLTTSWRSLSSIVW